MKNLVFKIFFLIFSQLLLPQVTETADLFVSRTATKEHDCGRSEDDPCRTINAAIKVAKANSHINIIAEDNTVYDDCPIILTKPMVFVGKEGTPVIDCHGKNEAFLIKFDKKLVSTLKDTKLIVDIKKLKIQNATKGISFALGNPKTTLQVSEVVFQENAVDVNMKNSPLCFLKMKKVTLKGISGDGIQFDSCVDVKLELTTTKFLGKYFQIVSTKGDLSVKMSYVTVDMQTRSRSPEAKETRSPVHIETANNATNVNIRSSRFLNNAGKTNGSVTIVSPPNVVQKVRDVRIVVKFQNVMFENNSVTGDGGAVWLNVWFIKNKTKPATIHFEDCTFRANSAAFRGGALWLGSRRDKMTRFQNCSFHENRAYAPDAGQGGAVFCTGGKIIIENSYFQGNSASKRGGTLHIEGDASLNIADSTFENSHTSLNGIEGDVMFVDQKQTFFYGKITFDLQSANFQKSIFVFKGRPRTLTMINSTTRFICPKGYNYEEIALDTKMIRRGMYHLFAFSCKPCQDLYYSVERGSQHVNGSKYRAKCYKCPYGASCNGTIRAKANFWGMVQGDRVEMVACPRGYCCDREPCLSYDTCRSHRTGTLCGRCGDGFSEGISSTVCYPNEQCTSKYAWIWPLFCVVAIFTFFLFQQETFTKLGKCLLLNNEIPYRAQSQIQGEEDGDNEHDDEDEDKEEDESRERSERFSDNVQFSITHQDNNRIEESESFNNTGGYIKVLFYFYQVVFLLRVSSYSNQSSFPNLVIEFLLPFLNFQFSDEFTNCLIKDLTPIGKAYFKNSVGCCVLSLGLVSYLFYMLARRCKFGLHKDIGFEATSFPVRLIGAVVQIILQSYVALTLLAVQLLHCVELDGHHVLHIDGNVVCYTEPSQILMWLFLVFFIVSFPLVLIFGRRLLLSGHLTPGRFIVACFLPLPCLAYWGWLCWIEGFGKDNGQVTERNHYKEKILYILQHPYQPPASHDKRTVVEHLRENWESVLILRRLVLVLVVAFADSILLRAHFLFFFSIAILLLHVAIQPFVNKTVNQCETVSLGVILLFSGFDIAEAAFSYAGKSGPASVAVIQAMEDWIIALLPAFILAAVLYPRAKSHFARLCRSRPSFQSLQGSEMDI